MSIGWQFLIVGIGGFCGAISRFALGEVCRKIWPATPTLGTLIANVLGCFLIGCLMSWVIDAERFPNREALPVAWQMALVTGLLGSLTTFSTFAWQTLELAREGSFWAACWNVLLNLVIGLVAVIGGRFAMLSWFSRN